MAELKIINRENWLYIQSHVRSYIFIIEVRQRKILFTHTCLLTYTCTHMHSHLHIFLHTYFHEECDSPYLNFVIMNLI